MIRGTTPTIILNLPMEIAFDVLYITFNQNSNTVLEKTKDDVKMEKTVIAIPLSQADTLAFDSDMPVKIQLRGKVGETAYASKLVKVSVNDILKDGEI